MLSGDTACAESHTQTGAICPLLALLAHSAISGDATHFTHTESHAHRKAPSASCSHIQHSWKTPLILLAQNHTNTRTCAQTGAICPSLALLALAALSGDTACAESHMQTGAICPSLELLAHSALSGDLTHITRTESRVHRKASSAHRLRCSLIQRP